MSASVRLRTGCNFAGSDPCSARRASWRIGARGSALLLALGVACASTPDAAPRVPAPPLFLSSPAHEKLALPFSEAARVGDLLFVSGQIGNLPGTLELAPGGIRAETRQALANIAAILERNGSSLERVAKCTVFMLDMAEWPALNEVWVATFPNKPARSALGASGLAKGARVEIECIAAAGD
jgi:reactive intermediate/imine deaminase